MTMPTTNRVKLITQRLEQALLAAQIQIVDQSHLHSGHAGAQESGGGHFAVEVISPSFTHKSQLERHKMIYTALGDAMGKEIHAISISAKTPSEAATVAHLK